jgi:hypothetical protein
MAKRREYLAAYPPTPFLPSKTKSRVHGKVRAYALTKPEIDERKFARALLGLAKDMQKQQDARGGEGKAA